ncbi:MAG: retropepsin-like aspartic protease family protein [Flavobacterium sp.]
MSKKIIIVIVFLSFNNLFFGQKKEIYREDFNDNSNHWSEEKNDNIERFFRGGQYFILNKEETRMTWNTNKIKIDTNEDFVIESLITLNWDKSGGASIIFGEDRLTKKNFYTFKIQRTKGVSYAYIGKKIDGEWVAGVWKETKINDFGQGNKLTIRKKGNKIFYYVNDKQVYSKEFENFFGEGVGVCCEAQQNASFDYLIVKQDKQTISKDYVYETKRDEKTQSKNSTEIKLKNQNGIYEVPVELNGVLKIDFIFDSGASDVSISPDIAMTLIKTGTITENDWLPGAYYSFADGSSAKSMRFKLKSVKIGDKIVYDVTCSISNSLDAPMLLGQSVLSKFGKYSFDYKTEKLEIEINEK